MVAIMSPYRPTAARSAGTKFRVGTAIPVRLRPTWCPRYCMTPRRSATRVDGVRLAELAARPAQPRRHLRAGQRTPRPRLPATPAGHTDGVPSSSSPPPAAARRLTTPATGSPRQNSTDRTSWEQTLRRHQPHLAGHPGCHRRCGMTRLMTRCRTTARAGRKPQPRAGTSVSATRGRSPGSTAPAPSSPATSRAPNGTPTCPVCRPSTLASRSDPQPSTVGSRGQDTRPVQRVGRPSDPGAPRPRPGSRR
jgi:hypothetical protein